ncbi:MAG: hypothetical protein IKF78_03835 [Atopobiaceae bacterium]|nr:hypothetical protein [Atopobiaceae bacterium]
MRYRDISHKNPAPGVQLPAFVVSEYDGGNLLLYSHGSFDIWCVYYAIRLDRPARYIGKRAGASYPLRLDTIQVNEMTGTQTDFTGNLLPSITLEYDSRVNKYSFDAPEDVKYMQEIRDLATKYGQDRVWNSFLTIYDSIPQERGVRINRRMTETVTSVASQYPMETGLRLTLDCLLCAMIAENNRLRKYGSSYDTKLGKKVKALGIHQAIYETQLSIRQVADYSKDKSWKWISKECRNRDILTPDFS